MRLKAARLDGIDDMRENNCSFFHRGVLGRFNGV
jgi:hypothetical protein